MTAIPMCPGCRAILDPGTEKCPYCGWEIERTAVRREGDSVERALKALGGLSGSLALANILLAVFTAAAHARIFPALLEANGLEVPEGPSLILDGIIRPHAVTLLALGAFEPVHVLEGGEAWRFFTCMFLHFGVLHLFFNLSAIHWPAPFAVEAYGAAKALALYLLGGIAAAAAGLAWFLIKERIGMEARPYAGAGASGAICAWAGMLGAIGLRVGGRRGREWWKAMVKPVGTILVLGLVLAAVDAGFQLGNAEHAGGLLFGTLVGLVVSFGARARSSLWAVKAWNAAALLLSLLCVASFVQVALSLLPG